MLQILHAVPRAFYVQYCVVLSGVTGTVVQHGMPARLVLVTKKGLIGRRIRDIQRLVTGPFFSAHFKCLNQ
jgi:hypothetical protein